MSTKKRFTEEQMQILMANPYVKNVTPAKITYSLEFKQKAVAQAEQGMKSIKIFNEAGLGEDILGKERIYSAMKAFKREAKSPEGLREPGGRSKEERMAAFAKEDLSKKQTKAAIKELQDKVVHLEQMLEFLKKTQFPPK